MNLILLWSSAVRVHNSQAYRKMDVTRERISRIFELREILLSIQTGFSLVNAVACAILESISGLESSSVITEPRYLKLVTVSSFCPFTLISVLLPLDNTKWTTPKPDLFHSSEEALPIRGEQCQNRKFFRSRHWK